MRFAAALWLAGLVSILLPVVLHLRSRRPARVRRVGSIAHLIRAEPPRTERRRLDDRWLLALRIAILAITAAALADPRTPVTQTAPRGALIIAGRLHTSDDSTRIQALVDSLSRLHDTVLTVAEHDVWRAASQLDSRTDSVTMLVPDPLRLAGARPALAATLTVIPLATPPDTEAESLPTEATSEDVAILTRPPSAPQVTYLRAAIRAVAESRGVQVRVVDSSAGPSSTVFTVGLSRSAEDSIAAGGRRVIASGTSPARSVGRGTVEPLGMDLARASRARLLSDELPSAVSAVWPRHEFSQSYGASPRWTSARQLEPETSGRQSRPRPEQRWQPLLLWLALGLLAFERALALFRRRRVTG